MSHCMTSAEITCLGDDCYRQEVTHKTKEKYTVSPSLSDNIYSMIKMGISLK